MRMEKEIAKESPRRLHYKLGQGGLADIEFAVQYIQLKMGKIYSVEESPDEIPTVNVFPKVGAFISITYNVSRFAKE